MRYAGGVCAVVLAVLAAGCTTREARLEQLRTDDPPAQASAIAEVVRAGDRSMVPELIDLLDAKDEGVRFMAATGLHQLTGKDFGCHFATAEERQDVIIAWRQWWKTQQKAK
ncbi:MAG: HEAT repeat domain-containing protein [Planctomycetota bacterium]|nr:HEAT repeat domain-containing protein [Planctomycetota bacterium]